jgi:hypothetical protein
VRLGGKVGAVGLEKEGASGNLLDAEVKFLGVFKSDDAGERDGVAHMDQLFGLREGARKAVKDCLEAPGVGLESADGIFPAISLMNDNVEAKLHCKIQLLLEKDRLAILLLSVC